MHSLLSTLSPNGAENRRKTPFGIEAIFHQRCEMLKNNHGLRRHSFQLSVQIEMGNYADSSGSKRNYWGSDLPSEPMLIERRESKEQQLLDWHVSCGARNGHSEIGDEKAKWKKRGPVIAPPKTKHHGVNPFHSRQEIATVAQCAGRRSSEIGGDWQQQALAY
jgi:hypothetical protein